MTLLCALCESSSGLTLTHPNDNILGYLGFLLVVVMIIRDKAKKKKAAGK